MNRTKMRRITGISALFLFLLFSLFSVSTSAFSSEYTNYNLASGEIRTEDLVLTGDDNTLVIALIIAAIIVAVMVLALGYVVRKRKNGQNKRK